MEADRPQEFKTLRGFLDGHESQEPEYFAYRATLRISGDSLDFDDISRELQVSPTHTHRRGEVRAAGSVPARQDMWLFEAPIPEDRPLSEHIDTLWATIRHAVPYILALKQRADVNVFLGYRSNIDHAGVEVPYTSLEIFQRLEVPFGLSVIIT